MGPTSALRHTVHEQTLEHPPTALQLVSPPPPRRPRWRVVLAVMFSILLIAVPMALHAFLDVTGSAVLSDSMRPAFKAGDVILTRAESAGDLAVGDVVVLTQTSDGEPRAHRVREIYLDGTTLQVVTQGDANPEADPAVTLTRDETVRVVVGRIPALGRIVLALENPTTLVVGAGLLLAANVIALLLLLFPRSDRRWGPPAPR